MNGDMPALAAYCKLDLTPSSSIAQRLKTQLESETKNVKNGTVIDLTKARRRFDSKGPGGFTPAMAAWYSANIAGPRGQAISEIHNAFQNEPTPSGSPQSSFLELKCDEMRSQSIAVRINRTVQFLDHNKNTIENFNEAQYSYNLIKAGLGREPQNPRPVFYIVSLGFLVTLELFINFESFMKVPFITSPFLATGATAAVATAIATAAHNHGIVIKQWNYLGSAQDPTDHSHSLGGRRRDAIRRIVIGAVLLIIALSMVGGSRYYYLKDYIMQAQILGSNPPSMFSGIAFMLLGNVVAYLIAVYLSYSVHDANPNYAEKSRTLKKYTKLMDKIRLTRKSEQASDNNGLSKAVAHETNLAANSKGPNYLALRSYVGELVGKDQEAVAILYDYRNALVSALNEAAKYDEYCFRLPEGAFDEIVPSTLDSLLTPRQFAAETIKLGFSSGEH